MTTRHLWLGCALLAALIGTTAQADRPALIPVEQFFSDPAIVAVKVSPGGHHVAFLAPIGKRIGVALMDLDSGKVEPLVSAGDENIKDFYWKGNDFVVYVADVGGNEAYAVQSINIKTRRITRLLESFGENNEDRQGGNWGSVLDFWITNSKKIIVRGGRDEKSTKAGTYEVDVSTGKRSEVGADPEDIRSRIKYFDNAGLVRLDVVDNEKDVEVKARLGSSMSFTTIMKLPRDLHLSSLDQAVILADNQTLLWVDYRKVDRGAVVAWDLNTGKEKAVLFVPPEGEITQLIVGRDRAKLLGVRYEADKEHVAWFDPEFAGVQAAVDKTFPGTLNVITNWTEDRKKILVYATSDVESGVNFILDRSGPQPRLVSLGSARPNLDSKLLNPMVPVHFKARDGLELQGYLTKPAGAKGPLPLILNPHGGPYGVRDSWGYNPEVQFLANRGFAVLQVNYRGSGGFGRNFLEAGRLEWGKKMQDDLTDAVQWAIAEGITDAKHVGIYGASYGGYAALAGAVFTPDLFRCAINYVGVADMTYLGRRDQGGNRVMNDFFYTKWIHPDMDELARRSPANHVEAIKIPMLHAYGENDPRVEWRQWKKLKAELDKHHIPYEAFNQEDEGHGFGNAKARVGFYLKMEDFLMRNMFADGEVKLGELKVLEMPAK